jgi:predicted outer membrane protein
MTLKKLIKPLIPVLLATFGLSGVAIAQEQPQQQPQQPEQQQPEQQQPQPQQMQRQEGEALARVWAANEAYTDLGILGVNRAENEQVREFASELAERGQQNNLELMSAANDLNIDVAGTEEQRQAEQEIEERTQQQMQRLEQLEGAQFDREYPSTVEQVHGERAREL